MVHHAIALGLHTNNFTTAFSYTFIIRSDLLSEISLSAIEEVCRCSKDRVGESKT